MSKRANIQRIRSVVCEQLGVTAERLDDDANIEEAYGADSLDLVELVMDLEDEFEISIPDADLEKVRSVTALNTYVEKRLGGKA